MMVRYLLYIKMKKVHSGRLLILFSISPITDMSVLTSEWLWALKELIRRQMTTTNGNIMRAPRKAVLDHIQIHVELRKFFAYNGKVNISDLERKKTFLTVNGDLQPDKSILQKSWILLFKLTICFEQNPYTRKEIRKKINP